MKYDVRQLPLISNEEIAQGIFDMRLEYRQDDLPVMCGQFAHVYVPGKTLRRPTGLRGRRAGASRKRLQGRKGQKILPYRRRYRSSSDALHREELR